jgi:dTMP kinase
VRVLERHGPEHDRIEREDVEFYERVDAAYRALAERFPERIVPLDGARPADELAEEVYGALRAPA